MTLVTKSCASGSGPGGLLIMVIGLLDPYYFSKTQRIAEKVTYFYSI
jgi:hypothetical protein